VGQRPRGRLHPFSSTGSSFLLVELRPPLR
jgi:hypothetical protein